MYTACRALSHTITSRFGTKSFKKNVDSLEYSKFYHYHSLLPSTVHALIQVIGTCSFVFYGRDGYDNTLAEGESPAVIFEDRITIPYGITKLGPSVYGGIFVGYLLADVALAPSFAIMGYPFVIHHLAASACWTYCACNRIMQPVACLFQFNELSTPLMNIRQYLLTAGYTSSDLPVAISSLIFFAAFGLIRVAPLPFVMKDWILRDFTAIQQETGVGGAILVSLFFAVNASLQIGWFFIMCQKLVGMLSKLPKKKLE